jgi:hypothetical protein
VSGDGRLGHVNVSIVEPMGWISGAKSVKRVTALPRYPARRRVAQIVNEHDARQAIRAETVESPACHGTHGGRCDAAAARVSRRPVVDLTLRKTPWRLRSN